MRDEWKAEVVKKLYQFNISRKELAKELGCTTSYVNMVLADKRNPSGAEDKFSAAVERLQSRRAEDTA